MSGFTTTGSTVLRDVEAVSHSLAIWRQLSQWLGGMGIIILAIAILPRLRIGGRQLLEAELPGPEIEQLTTRIRDTARRLWFLYVGLTVTAFLVLSLLAWTGVDPAMNTFEAAAHALTSIPTAGFSTEQASIGTFGAATQWAIVTFMVLGGANFALMYRALARRSARVIARDEELRLYLALLAAASIAIAAELLRAGTLAGEEAIRHGTFQAVSMMTTTGYSTINYDAWPLLALVLLIGLMFVGGSAGSTTGSVKVVRHLLMGKILHRELDQTVHPEIVSRIRLNRAAVDERTLRAITSFVLIYIGLFIVGTLLLSLDAERVDFDLRLIDAIGVAATALGNVGPAFGPAGPGGSFEPFSDFSKLVLIGLMWLGRLEIIPIIVLFTRNYWRA